MNRQKGETLNRGKEKRKRERKRLRKRDESAEGWKSRRRVEITLGGREEKEEREKSCDRVFSFGH